MGRSPCCDKNNNVLKKGPWTQEEDQKLINYIHLHGPGNWRTLPKNAGLQRCGKSCRLRWTNYLRPDIKRGRFSFEEEETIIQLHSILGNKWSAIAARLPGRTDNEIKNYWNTHIRKRLLRSGIDPVTHTPRLDLFDISSLLKLSQLNNILGLQAALGNNPHVLRLLTTLAAATQNNDQPQTPHHHLQMLQKLQEVQQLSNDNNINIQDQNPQLLLQKLQEIDQSLNSPIQSSTFDQNSDKFLDTTPPCPTSNNVFSSPSSSLSSQYTMNPLASLTGQGVHHEDLVPTNENFVTSLENYYGYFGPEFSEGCNRNFGIGSVLSTTPLSSPASTTFVNSEEDEKESDCSDTIMKFEVPESLDFEDLL